MSAATAEHAEHELLTTHEVARRWRVSDDLVRRLAASGELPAIRIGSLWRFRRVDVERLLAPVRGDA